MLQHRANGELAMAMVWRLTVYWTQFTVVAAVLRTLG